MKIALLSRNAELYSTKRLVEAAVTRGHQVEVIDPILCYMNINHNALSIHYKGEAFVVLMLCYPELARPSPFYGSAVLRQFEMMNVYCLNNAAAIGRARDKLDSLQLFSP